MRGSGAGGAAAARVPVAWRVHSPAPSSSAWAAGREWIEIALVPALSLLLGGASARVQHLELDRALGLQEQRRLQGQLTDVGGSTLACRQGQLDEGGAGHRRCPSPRDRPARGGWRVRGARSAAAGRGRSARARAQPRTRRRKPASPPRRHSREPPTAQGPCAPGLPSRRNVPRKIAVSDSSSAASTTSTASQDRVRARLDQQAIAVAQQAPGHLLKADRLAQIAVDQYSASSPLVSISPPSTVE